MSQADYSLNAKVRMLLVRKGFDLSRLEYGVTNGVVYILGTLRTSHLQSLQDATESRLEEAALASWLERVLHQTPGVRDVVLKLDRLKKIGTRWRTK